MSAVALLLFLTTVNFSPLLCKSEASEHFWEELARKRIYRISSTFPSDVPPKNVILFIGDGMGLSTVATARMYKSEKEEIPYSENPFFFEEFLTAGLVKTSSLNKHVTDSAASAMALYSGRKVMQETLGLRPGYKDDCSAGYEARIDDGIAELALRKNMSVGFITTDRITGATPAALYAKSIRRYLESDFDVEKKNSSLCKGRDIAQQLLNYPANEFKVMMGGGRMKLKTERKDGIDLMEEWKELTGERRVVQTPLELKELDMDQDFKLLGVFSENIFPFFLDEGNKTTAPRLMDMTERALQVLQKNNENGFFLMVEGGIIDTAEHRNKMRLASEEVLEFDEAVKMAREMTDPRDTLILVTADHSHAVALSGEIDKTASIFEDPHFVSPAAIFARYGSHGAEDVGIWADGPTSRFFSGTMDNTAVAQTLKYILCLNEKETMCDSNIQTLKNNECGSLIPAIIVAVVACLVAIGSIIMLMFILQRFRSKRSVDIGF